MQQEAEPSCQGAGHPVPQTVEGFTPSHPRARQREPPPCRHSPLTGHASHGAQHSLPPPPQSSPHLGPALRAGDTCSEKLRGEPPSVFPIAPLPAAAGTHSPHCQTQCLSRRGAEACPEQVSSAKHVYALHAQGQAMCSDERGRLVLCTLTTSPITDPCVSSVYCLSLILRPSRGVQPCAQGPAGVPEH